ncbi:MAG: glycosyltransferase family 39 protein, partial [Clostridia bacterium]|nr:glycosyltransferase family 39 protein [Clostridia bacterium]
AFLTIRTKGKGHLPLICAAMISFMFCFGLKMHERYLFPVLPLLVFAYIEERDVRTVCSLILASVGCFLNMEAVLIYGYTIHAPAALTAGISAMNIASCALLIWAGVDICIFKHTFTFTRIYRRAKSARALHAPALSRLKMEEDWRINLKKGEIILMAAVTLAYSVFTFANLGTRKAPETDWISSEAGETVTFDLGSAESFTFTYYGGICNCTFDVSISQDGSEFTSLGPAQYDQGEIFRWLRFEPEIPTQDRVLTARFLRITAQKTGLVLRECGFLDESGDPLLVQRVMTSGSGNALALIDEQDTVPPYPSYYNSSYFDEIYHVRTAYEHIHGMTTYEWTHPPLGKLLIACGILLFGMNPFGWRFAGAVAGIIMVPLMYLIIRQLTKNRFAAFFGMMLLTLDCMHFTQTRIGTIDSFAVMFIMFMYLFMFRYVKMSFHRQPLKKTLVPLALCGTAFALGCASKWICIYAGAGLAVLFFYTLSLRYSEYRAAGAVLRQQEKEDRTVLEHTADVFPRYTVITLLWCCLFFIAVPLAVYYLSYYWQLAPENNFTIKGVWDTQVSIFRYHNSLSGDTHYFRSPWYEWPLIVRPMWYYSGTKFLEEGMISSISCMGNPAVWWGSLVGLFYAFFRTVQSKGRSRPFLIVSIAFLSQYAPWILISRSTFIYHYFASVPFIIAASALMLAELYKRSRKTALILGWSWMGAALALCVMFYPLMSGLPIPRTYAKYLRWFRWYNY